MAKIFSVTSSQLVIDYRAREWCKLPYIGHPNGCPNYGKKSKCPPQAPLLEKFFDIDKELWVVIVEFNMKNHMDKMKLRHPEWSDRQARCVLYWQNSVNKKLTGICKQISGKFDSTTYTICPEAMGVNVIKTVKKLKVPIHSRPKDIVYKVGLVGYLK